MARTNYASTVGVWRRLLDSIHENMAEHPDLEAARTKLAGMHERLQELRTRQAALAAAKQAATREMQAILEDGRLTATFLRIGLKTHYGARSERLVEFGIQPFRGRSRRKKAPPSRD